MQTRDSASHPFSAINRYVPLTVEYELYKIMREAVPLIDSVPGKIVRLMGAFEIKCDSDNGQNEIKDFLDNVRVNSKQKGIQAFTQSYIDQLLECGNSCAEIILNNAKNDIYAIKNVDVRTIKLKYGDDTLETVVCQEQDGSIGARELPYQDLILFTPLYPENGSPYGVSVFRSMPFMTGILLKIFNSMGNNWERFGNLKYSVVYKPKDGEELDEEDIKERLKLIEKHFRNAMDAGKKGKAADFYGVGDIEIKVIGADNQVLDSQIPVQQVLEQIVARTGIPPFLFGLSWSTTERMSQQQADFLTSELESYRDIVTPVIEYIIDLWQTVTGRNIPYEIKWEDINLQDMVEISKANVYNAQAEGKKIDNVLKKRDEGIISQEDAARELGYEKAYKKQGASTDKSKGQVLNALLKSPFNSPPEDNVQLEIEQETYEGYMKCVNRFEKRVLDLVQISAEKSMGKTKELPEDYVERIHAATESFITEMVGDGIDNNYGTYGQYFLHSFGYGTVRGNKTTKEEHPDLASNNNIVIANYDHPYVRELMDKGMERVKTKAKTKSVEVIEIMADHSAFGDNPTAWARELKKELKESITGENWYWERLARSESAMAIDMAERAEYEAEGFGYCEWDAAPDACHICSSLHGSMWPVGEAPLVVVDTHPHCRCRVLPRTTRQYDEYRGENTYY